MRYWRPFFKCYLCGKRRLWTWNIFDGHYACKCDAWPGNEKKGQSVRCVCYNAT